MDAIEILGSLLGGGQSRGQGGGGGLGGKILNEMMRGGARQPAPQAPTQTSAAQQTSPATRSPVNRPVDLQREASELEDLLNVAKERVEQRRQDNDHQAQNEDAILLIRAMINAAKADGTISRDEQQTIIERIGNPTQEVLNFLQQEFNQPLNVRDFAWSVPLGLEHKVYSISLAAIDLDHPAEANYLRELAHGLRLAPEVCNQIHGQFNAPLIF